MRHSKKQSPRPSPRKSVKRYSAKRKSVKRHSAKRKTPRRVVKSHYRMRGMGALLSMYGQAGGALEDDVAEKKKELQKLQDQYKAEKNAERRAQIEKAMASAQVSINEAKEKMKNLLQGAADTASKAAATLGSKLSLFGAKLSSGIKSTGAKLSSGIKSATSQLKDKYDDYKERSVINDSIKAQQQANRAQKKADELKDKASKTSYASSTSSKSTSSSPSTDSDASSDSIPLKYDPVKAAWRY